MSVGPRYPLYQPCQSRGIPGTTDYVLLILQRLRPALLRAPRPGFLVLPGLYRQSRQPHRVWRIQDLFRRPICYTVAMHRSSFPHHRGERKYLVVFALTWMILFFLVLPCNSRFKANVTLQDNTCQLNEISNLSFRNRTSICKITLLFLWENMLHFI